MSRITKTRSRRKTALWRLLAAVLVLALAWLSLGTSLSPGQTIRRAERLCGLEETLLLRQESIAGVTLSFSENDDAFLVTTHRLDWRLNWWNISTPLLLIDRGKGDPHCQAGALTFFDQDEKTDTVFLFGWTDLPDAVLAAADSPDETDSTEDSSYACLTAPVEEEGYFWAKAVLPNPPEQSLRYPKQLRLLDRAGEVLLTYDLSDHWALRGIPTS